MLCLPSFLLLFGQARAITIPYLSIPCSYPTPIYTHALYSIFNGILSHSQFLYSTHLPCTATATTTLPTKLISHLPLKSAFHFPFLPSVYLFPIYYTIKQKLCNPFFPFLSSITRSYYNCYNYREAYTRQAGFPFSFFLLIYTSIVLYTLFYQIIQSRHHCFLSPFQKYYVPFFFFCFWLVFFFPF